jgi:hypothetical protein
MKKLTIDSQSSEYFTDNGSVTFQENNEFVFIILKIESKGKEEKMTAMVDKENLLAVFKALSPRDCSF